MASETVGRFAFSERYWHFRRSFNPLLETYGGMLPHAWGNVHTAIADLRQQAESYADQRLITELFIHAMTWYFALSDIVVSLSAVAYDYVKTHPNLDADRIYTFADTFAVEHFVLLPGHPLEYELCELDYHRLIYRVIVQIIIEYARHYPADSLTGKRATKLAQQWDLDLNIRLLVARDDYIRHPL